MVRALIGKVPQRYEPPRLQHARPLTVNQTVLSLLMDHRGMLRDHYSLDINDAGQLVSIPLLLKGYTPNLGKLPSFLLRLGPNVCPPHFHHFFFFFHPEDGWFDKTTASFSASSSSSSVHSPDQPLHPSSCIHHIFFYLANSPPCRSTGQRKSPVSPRSCGSSRSFTFRRLHPADLLLLP